MSVLDRLRLAAAREHHKEVMRQKEAAKRAEEKQRAEEAARFVMKMHRKRLSQAISRKQREMERKEKERQRAKRLSADRILENQETIRVQRLSRDRASRDCEFGCLNA